MKTALTIAGSDSSGGAGIQADIKTMTANGVYAMSAITALTAQNTTGVSGIYEVTPDFLKAQIDSVFTDIRPDAVKTGMVSSTALIEVIAERLSFYKAENIVVDPVMVSTSGSKLLQDNAVDALKNKLIKIASLVTPNIPEAQILSGMEVKTKEDMQNCAKKIYEEYGCSILLKGGHSINDAHDLLYDGSDFTWFEGRRINNPNTHGTGCTLSSAIAANLAKGCSLGEAVRRAKNYISGALEAMLDLGAGSGPLNHAFNISGEFANSEFKAAQPLTQIPQKIIKLNKKIIKDGKNLLEKTYSRIDEIPSGQASQELTEGCLVLEGGAFRGLYTQGFLDALMLAGINLSCVIGVSAGALGGVNYVSGQIGRSARINLNFRIDSRYIGTKSIANSHSILDVGFLTEDRGIIPEPLNEERFYSRDRRFVAVASNLLTGDAQYFEKGDGSDIMAGIRASATLPFVSPAFVIDGVPYLDGGCVCKIPYEWALEQGYRKIMVIRTREITFRTAGRRNPAAVRIYGKYAEFAEKLANNEIDYNKQCDELEKLQADGALMQFAPSRKPGVIMIERDLEKLGELYWLGFNDCNSRLDEIKNYLKSQ